MKEIADLHQSIETQLNTLLLLNKRIATLNEPATLDFETLRAESIALHKFIMQLEISERKAQPVSYTLPKSEPLVVEEKAVEKEIPLAPTIEENIQVIAIKETLELFIEPESHAAHAVSKPEKVEKVDNLNTLSSVNDKFTETVNAADLAAKFNGTPINDLKKAISINKKFEFINSLFRQNHELYARSIHSLNNFSASSEAEEFLKALAEKDLDLENADLMDELQGLVKRRYMS